MRARDCATREFARSRSSDGIGPACVRMRPLRRGSRFRLILVRVGVRNVMVMVLSKRVVVVRRAKSGRGVLTHVITNPVNERVTGAECDLVHSVDITTDVSTVGPSHIGKKNTSAERQSSMVDTKPATA
jgi:hypothetical protein